VAGKVGVIPGGGSGHEPTDGGYAGMGMLDATCPGARFAHRLMIRCLLLPERVDGGRGVLHIVKDYTGDVMNFEVATELAAAEGIEVKSVVTNDHVAAEDSLHTAGGRGERVTVLPEKTVDAAEAGSSLDELVTFG
jgi:dihydroxyacetone kinase-like protein